MDFLAVRFFAETNNDNLNVLAIGADVCQHFLNAELINRLDAAGGHTQSHPAVFARNPETMPLQVRLKAALGSVVGVRDIIARHGLFARHLTLLSHRITLLVEKLLMIEVSEDTIRPVKKANAWRHFGN